MRLGLGAMIEEEPGGRERVFKITRKGEDFILLFTRLLALLAGGAYGASSRCCLARCG